MNFRDSTCFLRLLSSFLITEEVRSNSITLVSNATAMLHVGCYIYVGCPCHYQGPLPIPMANQANQAKSRAKLVNLPSTYKQWPEIKDDLRNLAEMKLRGVGAFEEVCKKHDRWEQVKTPFSLLRRILSDGTHVTEEFFCETLLPWIAGKALQVEELFKDANQQLPVSFMNLCLQWAGRVLPLAS